MTFQQIIQKALAVRQKYFQLEKEKYGREWTPQELMSGFVGDVGDLSKLIQAKSGVREIDDVDEKLKHELSDCLWSIIILADQYNIDLEKEFGQTMNSLEERISNEA
ncbi:MAG: nucleotide pyrophosphohydrolase [Pseudomonadales bacterium]|nr:nucleotide pyrophosphohydrolase [Pseudomonadales bacterium]